jgi:hypothetical protein
MRTSRKAIVLVVVGVLVLALGGLAFAACGSESTDTTATTAAPATTAAQTDSTAGGDAAASGSIAVSGLVDNPMTLTVAELEKLGTESYTVQHPKKGEVTYTGVSFPKVLEALKVQAAAKSIVLIASDGYAAEVTMGDAGADSFLAIEDGTISSVFPALDGKSWVKDIIQMKFQ